MESAQAEQEFHAQAIVNMNQEIAKLQSRIERCYIDHLDGKITNEEWESRTGLWKAEQADLRLKIRAYDSADLRYMQEGVKLLELASRAHELFTTTMTPAEKREIVSLVLSNPRIEDGSVRYEMKMPFSLMLNGTDSKNWLGNLDEFRTWCRSQVA